MRICDLCKNNAGHDTQGFDATIGGKYFHLRVMAKANPESEVRIDLCPDCAAKGALMVLGATTPKCADGKCNCPPVEM